MERPSAQLVTLEMSVSAVPSHVEIARCGAWHQTCTWPASRALLEGVARHLFMTALLVVLGTVRQITYEM